MRGMERVRNRFQGANRGYFLRFSFHRLMFFSVSIFDTSGTWFRTVSGNFFCSLGPPFRGQSGDFVKDILQKRSSAQKHLIFESIMAG